MTLEEFRELPWPEAEDYILFMQLIRREEQQQQRRRDSAR